MKKGIAGIGGTGQPSFPDTASVFRFAEGAKGHASISVAGSYFVPLPMRGLHEIRQSVAPQI